MKLKSLLIITLSSLVLTSCLKSRDTLGVFGDKGSIVSEIWDVNYYGGVKPYALDVSPATETFDDFLTLKAYAARDNQPAGGKVHIKLELDDAAVTDAGLTVLPAANYTLPSSLEFDVPANGEIKIPFTLNKAGLDLSNSYGLGFKIADVSSGVASELAKSIVVNVLIKNKYDGVYEVSGTMVDAVNSSLTHINDYLSANGYDNMQYELRTTGATSCEVYDNYFFGGHYVPITSGGTDYSSYGSYSLIINFDPATDDIVSVTNYYGQPAGNGRSAQLDPTGVNHWDGASKTMQIKYQLVGGPGTSSPSQVRTTWDETWKRIGAR